MKSGICWVCIFVGLSVVFVLLMVCSLFEDSEEIVFIVLGCVEEGWCLS